MAPPRHVTTNSNKATVHNQSARQQSDHGYEEVSSITESSITPTLASSKNMFSPPLANTTVVTTTPQQEYIKWRELQAGISSVEDAKRVVQTFVRETLFPKLKFIMSDIELEYVGKLNEMFFKLFVHFLLSML